MLRSVALYALLGAFTAGIAGCTTNGTMGEASDFTLPDHKPEPVQATELVPGDSIEISVEVDGRMEVLLHRASLNHQGVATLPLVGDVRLGGLGLDIARAVIAKRYGTLYVSTPVVMMSLVRADAVAEWGQVRVLGRVRQPGPVPLTSASGINLSAAIQGAGGFATSAKTTEIQVTRPSATGNRLRVVVDFNKIGREGDTEADLRLMDGDIVFVPERIF